MKSNKLNILTLLGATTLSLAGCVTGKSKMPEAKASRVTLDINPSFELILDDNGLVASVNSLNDDAILVTIDLDFTGKSVEDVVDLLVEESTKLGFLDKSNKDGENTVYISASSSSEEWTNCLLDQVKSSVAETLDKYGINKDIKEQASQTVEEMKAYLENTCGIVMENANATYEECLSKLSEYRDIANQFYSTEYASLYLDSITYFEGYYDLDNTFDYIQELINNDEVLNTLTIAKTQLTGLLDVAKGYLDQYKLAIDGFIEEFKEQFVDGTSLYQTAKDALLDAKVELAKYRNSDESTDALITQAESTLALAEQTLESAKATAEGLVATAKSLITTADALLKSAASTLTTFAKSISSLNFSDEDLETFKNAAENIHNYYTEEFANNQTYQTEKAALKVSIETKKASIKAELNVTVSNDSDKD